MASECFIDCTFKVGKDITDFGWMPGDMVHQIRGFGSRLKVQKISRLCSLKYCRSMHTQFIDLAFSCSDKPDSSSVLILMDSSAYPRPVQAVATLERVVRDRRQLTVDTTKNGFLYEYAAQFRNQGLARFLRYNEGRVVRLRVYAIPNVILDVMQKN